MKRITSSSTADGQIKVRKIDDIFRKVGTASSSSKISSTGSAASSAAANVAAESGTNGGGSYSSGAMTKGHTSSAWTSGSWESLLKEMPILESLKERSWQIALIDEVRKPYFKALDKSIRSAYSTSHVYPPSNLIFEALNQTPLDQVRVVIIGQDPYHKHGQAHGLSFSVSKGVTIPPSLRRIYKELSSDPEIDPKFVAPSHGCLYEWAQQGVLLLNATLTVEAGKPNSHQSIGWQYFTDAVIRAVLNARRSVVFLLWGQFAQKKASFVDRSSNFVLEGAHPSPLAGDKWLNNRHFSKANKYLEEHGEPPVNWSLK